MLFFNNKNVYVGSFLWRVVMSDLLFVKFLGGRLNFLFFFITSLKIVKCIFKGFNFYYLNGVTIRPVFLFGQRVFLTYIYSILVDVLGFSLNFCFTLFLNLRSRDSFLRFCEPLTKWGLFQHMDGYFLVNSFVGMFYNRFLNPYFFKFSNFSKVFLYDWEKIKGRSRYYQYPYLAEGASPAEYFYTYPVSWRKPKGKVSIALNRVFFFSFFFLVFKYFGNLSKSSKYLGLFPNLFFEFQKSLVWPNYKQTVVSNVLNNILNTRSVNLNITLTKYRSFFFSRNLFLQNVWAFRFSNIFNGTCFFYNDSVLYNNRIRFVHDSLLSKDLLFSRFYYSRFKGFYRIKNFNFNSKLVPVSERKFLYNSFNSNFTDFFKSMRDAFFYRESTWSNFEDFYTVKDQVFHDFFFFSKNFKLFNLSGEGYSFTGNNNNNNKVRLRLQNVQKRRLSNVSKYNVRGLSGKKYFLVNSKLGEFRVFLRYIKTFIYYKKYNIKDKCIRGFKKIFYLFFNHQPRLGYNKVLHKMFSGIYGGLLLSKFKNLWKISPLSIPALGLLRRFRLVGGLGVLYNNDSDKSRFKRSFFNKYSQFLHLKFDGNDNRVNFFSLIFNLVDSFLTKLYKEVAGLFLKNNLTGHRLNSVRISFLFFFRKIRYFFLKNISIFLKKGFLKEMQTSCGVVDTYDKRKQVFSTCIKFLKIRKFFYKVSFNFFKKFILRKGYTFYNFFSFFSIYNFKSINLGLINNLQADDFILNLSTSLDVNSQDLLNTLMEQRVKVSDLFKLNVLRDKFNLNVNVFPLLKRQYVYGNDFRKFSYKISRHRRYFKNEFHISEGDIHKWRAPFKFYFKDKQQERVVFWRTFTYETMMAGRANFRFLFKPFWRRLKLLGENKYKRRKQAKHKKMLKIKPAVFGFNVLLNNVKVNSVKGRRFHLKVLQAKKAFLTNRSVYRKKLRFSRMYLSRLNRLHSVRLLRRYRRVFVRKFMRFYRAKFQSVFGWVPYKYPRSVVGYSYHSLGGMSIEDYAALRRNFLNKILFKNIINKYALAVAGVDGKNTKKMWLQHTKYVNMLNSLSEGGVNGLGYAASIGNIRDFRSKLRFFKKKKNSALFLGSVSAEKGQYKKFYKGFRLVKNINLKQKLFFREVFRGKKFKNRLIVKKHVSFLRRRRRFPSTFFRVRRKRGVVNYTTSNINFFSSYFGYRNGRLFPTQKLGIGVDARGVANQGTLTNSDITPLHWWWSRNENIFDSSSSSIYKGRVRGKIATLRRFYSLKFQKSLILLGKKGYTVRRGFNFGSRKGGFENFIYNKKFSSFYSKVLFKLLGDLNIRFTSFVSSKGSGVTNKIPKKHIKNSDMYLLVLRGILNFRTLFFKDLRIIPAISSGRFTSSVLGNRYLQLFLLLRRFQLKLKRASELNRFKKTLILSNNVQFRRYKRLRFKELEWYFGKRSSRFAQLLGADKSFNLIKRTILKKERVYKKGLWAHVKYKKLRRAYYRVNKLFGNFIKWSSYPQAYTKNDEFHFVKLGRTVDHIKNFFFSYSYTKHDLYKFKKFSRVFKWHFPTKIVLDSLTKSRHNRLWQLRNITANKQNMFQSYLDVSKKVNALYRNPGKLEKFFGENVSKKKTQRLMRKNWHSKHLGLTLKPLYRSKYNRYTYYGKPLPSRPNSKAVSTFFRFGLLGLRVKSRLNRYLAIARMSKFNKLKFRFRRNGWYRKYIAEKRLGLYRGKYLKFKRWQQHYAKVRSHSLSFRKRYKRTRIIDRWGGNAAKARWHIKDRFSWEIPRTPIKIKWLVRLRYKWGWAKQPWRMAVVKRSINWVRSFGKSKRFGGYKRNTLLNFFRGYIRGKEFVPVESNVNEGDKYTLASSTRPPENSGLAFVKLPKDKVDPFLKQDGSSALQNYANFFVLWRAKNKIKTKNNSAIISRGVVQKGSVNFALWKFFLKGGSNRRSVVEKYINVFSVLRSVSINALFKRLAKLGSKTAVTRRKFYGKMFYNSKRLTYDDTNLFLKLSEAIYGLDSRVISMVKHLNNRYLSYMAGSSLFIKKNCFLPGARYLNSKDSLVKGNVLDNLFFKRYRLNSFLRWNVTMLRSSIQQAWVRRALIRLKKSASKPPTFFLNQFYHRNKLDFGPTSFADRWKRPPSFNRRRVPVAKKFTWKKKVLKWHGNFSKFLMHLRQNDKAGLKLNLLRKKYAKVVGAYDDQKVHRVGISKFWRLNRLLKNKAYTLLGLKRKANNRFQLFRNFKEGSSQFVNDDTEDLALSNASFKNKIFNISRSLGSKYFYSSSNNNNVIMLVNGFLSRRKRKKKKKFKKNKRLKISAIILSRDLNFSANNFYNTVRYSSFDDNKKYIKANIKAPSLSFYMWGFNKLLLRRFDFLRTKPVVSWSLKSNFLIKPYYLKKHHFGKRLHVGSLVSPKAVKFTVKKELFFNKGRLKNFANIRVPGINSSLLFYFNEDLSRSEHSSSEKHRTLDSYYKALGLSKSLNVKALMFKNLFTFFNKLNVDRNLENSLNPDMVFAQFSNKFNRVKNLYKKFKFVKLQFFKKLVNKLSSRFKTYKWRYIHRYTRSNNFFAVGFFLPFNYRLSKNFQNSSWWSLFPNVNMLGKSYSFLYNYNKVFDFFFINYRLSYLFFKNRILKNLFSRLYSLFIINMRGETLYNLNKSNFLYFKLNKLGLNFNLFTNRPFWYKQSLVSNALGLDVAKLHYLKQLSSYKNLVVPQVNRFISKFFSASGEINFKHKLVGDYMKLGDEVAFDYFNPKGGFQQLPKDLRAKFVNITGRNWIPAPLRDNFLDDSRLVNKALDVKISSNRLVQNEKLYGDAFHSYFKSKASANLKDRKLFRSKKLNDLDFVHEEVDLLYKSNARSVLLTNGIFRNVGVSPQIRHPYYDNVASFVNNNKPTLHWGMSPLYLGRGFLPSYILYRQDYIKKRYFKEFFSKSIISFVDVQRLFSQSLQSLCGAANLINGFSKKPHRSVLGGGRFAGSKILKHQLRLFFGLRGFKNRGKVLSASSAKGYLSKTLLPNAFIRDFGSKGWAKMGFLRINREYAFTSMPFFFRSYVRGSRMLNIFKRDRSSGADIIEVKPRIKKFPGVVVTKSFFNSRFKSSFLHENKPKVVNNFFLKGLRDLKFLRKFFKFGKFLRVARSERFLKLKGSPQRLINKKRLFYIQNLFLDGSKVLYSQANWYDLFFKFNKGSKLSFYFLKFKKRLRHLLNTVLYGTSFSRDFFTYTTQNLFNGFEDLFLNSYVNHSSSVICKNRFNYLKFTSHMFNSLNSYRFKKSFGNSVVFNTSFGWRNWNFYNKENFSYEDDEVFMGYGSITEKAASLRMRYLSKHLRSIGSVAKLNSAPFFKYSQNSGILRDDKGYYCNILDRVGKKSLFLKYSMFVSRFSEFLGVSDNSKMFLADNVNFSFNFFSYFNMMYDPYLLSVSAQGLPVSTFEDVLNYEDDDSGLNDIIVDDEDEDELINSGSQDDSLGSVAGEDGGRSVNYFESDEDVDVLNMPFLNNVENFKVNNFVKFSDSTTFKHVMGNNRDLMQFLNIYGFNTSSTKNGGFSPKSFGYESNALFYSEKSSSVYFREYFYGGAFNKLFYSDDSFYSLDRSSDYGDSQGGDLNNVFLDNLSYYDDEDEDDADENDNDDDGEVRSHVGGPNRFVTDWEILNGFAPLQFYYSRDSFDKNFNVPKFHRVFFPVSKEKFNKGLPFISRLTGKIYSNLFGFIKNAGFLKNLFVKYVKNPIQSKFLTSNSSSWDLQNEGLNLDLYNYMFCNVEKKKNYHLTFTNSDLVGKGGLFYDNFNVDILSNNNNRFLVSSGNKNLDFDKKEVSSFFFTFLQKSGIDLKSLPVANLFSFRTVYTNLKVNSLFDVINNYGTTGFNLFKFLRNRSKVKAVDVLVSPYYAALVVPDAVNANLGFLRNSAYRFVKTAALMGKKRVKRMDFRFRPFINDKSFFFFYNYMQIINSFNVFGALLKNDVLQAAEKTLMLPMPRIVLQKNVKLGRLNYSAEFLGSFTGLIPFFTKDFVSFLKDDIVLGLNPFKKSLDRCLFPQTFKMPLAKNSYSGNLNLFSFFRFKFLEKKLFGLFYLKYFIENKFYPKFISNFFLVKGLLSRFGTNAFSNIGNFLDNFDEQLLTKGTMRSFIKANSVYLPSEFKLVVLNYFLYLGLNLTRSNGNFFSLLVFRKSLCLTNSFLSFKNLVSSSSDQYLWSDLHIHNEESLAQKNNIMFFKFFNTSSNLFKYFDNLQARNKLFFYTVFNSSFSNHNFNMFNLSGNLYDDYSNSKNRMYLTKQTLSFIYLILKFVKFFKRGFFNFNSKISLNSFENFFGSSRIFEYVPLFKDFSAKYSYNFDPRTFLMQGNGQLNDKVRWVSGSIRDLPVYDYYKEKYEEFFYDFYDIKSFKNYGIDFLKWSQKYNLNVLLSVKASNLLDVFVKRNFYNIGFYLNRFGCNPLKNLVAKMSVLDVSRNIRFSKYDQFKESYKRVRQFLRKLNLFFQRKRRAAEFFKIFLRSSNKFNFSNMLLLKIFKSKSKSKGNLKIYRNKKFMNELVYKLKRFNGSALFSGHQIKGSKNFLNFKVMLKRFKRGFIYDTYFKKEGSGDNDNKGKVYVNKKNINKGKVYVNKKNINKGKVGAYKQAKPKFWKPSTRTFRGGVGFKKFRQRRFLSNRVRLPKFKQPRKSNPGIRVDNFKIAGSKSLNVRALVSKKKKLRGNKSLVNRDIIKSKFFAVKLYRLKQFFYNQDFLNGGGFSKLYDFFNRLLFLESGVDFVSLILLDNLFKLRENLDDNTVLKDNWVKKHGLVFLPVLVNVHKFLVNNPDIKQYLMVLLNDFYYGKTEYEQIESLLSSGQDLDLVDVFSDKSKYKAFISKSLNTHTRYKVYLNDSFLRMRSRSKLRIYKFDYIKYFFSVKFDLIRLRRLNRRRRNNWVGLLKRFDIFTDKGYILNFLFRTRNFVKSRENAFKYHYRNPKFSFLNFFPKGNLFFYVDSSKRSLNLFRYFMYKWTFSNFFLNQNYKFQDSYYKHADRLSMLVDLGFVGKSVVLNSKLYRFLFAGERVNAFFLNLFEFSRLKKMAEFRRRRHYLNKYEILVLKDKDEKKADYIMDRSLFFYSGRDFGVYSFESFLADVLSKKFKSKRFKFINKLDNFCEDYVYDNVSPENLKNFHAINLYLMKYFNRFYGFVRFRTYVKYYKKAKSLLRKRYINFFDPFLDQLENRLINVLAKVGFIASPVVAKQIILHGHVFVNNIVCRSINFNLSKGDVISLKRPFIYKMLQFFKVHVQAFFNYYELPVLRLSQLNLRLLNFLGFFFKKCYNMWQNFWFSFFGFMNYFLLNLSYVLSYDVFVDMSSFFFVLQDSQFVFKKQFNLLVLGFTKTYTFDIVYLKFFNIFYHNLVGSLFIEGSRSLGLKTNFKFLKRRLRYFRLRQIKVAKLYKRLLNSLGKLFVNNEELFSFGDFIKWQDTIKNYSNVGVLSGNVFSSKNTIDKSNNGMSSVNYFDLSQGFKYFKNFGNKHYFGFNSIFRYNSFHVTALAVFKGWFFSSDAIFYSNFFFIKNKKLYKTFSKLHTYLNMNFSKYVFSNISNLDIDSSANVIVKRKRKRTSVFYNKFVGKLLDSDVFTLVYFYSTKFFSKNSKNYKFFFKLKFLFKVVNFYLHSNLNTGRGGSRLNLFKKFFYRGVLYNNNYIMLWLLKLSGLLFFFKGLRMLRYNNYQVRGNGGMSNNTSKFVDFFRFLLSRRGKNFLGYKGNVFNTNTLNFKDINIYNTTIIKSKFNKQYLPGSLKLVNNRTRANLTVMPFKRLRFFTAFLNFIKPIKKSNAYYHRFSFINVSRFLYRRVISLFDFSGKFNFFIKHAILNASGTLLSDRINIFQLFERTLNSETFLVKKFVSLYFLNNLKRSLHLLDFLNPLNLSVKSKEEGGEGILLSSLGSFKTFLVLYKNMFLGFKKGLTVNFFKNRKKNQYIKSVKQHIDFRVKDKQLFGGGDNLGFFKVLRFFFNFIMLLLVSQETGTGYSLLKNQVDLLGFLNERDVSNSFFANYLPLFKFVLSNLKDSYVGSRRILSLQSSRSKFFKNLDLFRTNGTLFFNKLYVYKYNRAQLMLLDNFDEYVKHFKLFDFSFNNLENFKLHFLRFGGRHINNNTNTITYSQLNIIPIYNNLDMLFFFDGSYFNRRSFLFKLYDNLLLKINSLFNFFKLNKFVYKESGFDLRVNFYRNLRFWYFYNLVKFKYMLSNTDLLSFFYSSKKLLVNKINYFKYLAVFSDVFRGDVDYGIISNNRTPSFRNATLGSGRLHFFDIRDLLGNFSQLHLNREKYKQGVTFFSNIFLKNFIFKKQVVVDLNSAVNGVSLLNSRLKLLWNLGVFRLYNKVWRGLSLDKVLLNKFFNFLPNNIAFSVNKISPHTEDVGVLSGGSSGFSNTSIESNVNFKFDLFFLSVFLKKRVPNFNSSVWGDGAFSLSNSNSVNNSKRVYDNLKNFNYINNFFKHSNSNVGLLLNFRYSFKSFLNSVNKVLKVKNFLNDRKYKVVISGSGNVVDVFSKGFFKGVGLVNKKHVVRDVVGVSLVKRLCSVLHYIDASTFRQFRQGYANTLSFNNSVLKVNLFSKFFRYRYNYMFFNLLVFNVLKYGNLNKYLFYKLNNNVMVFGLGLKKRLFKHSFYWLFKGLQDLEYKLLKYKKLYNKLLFDSVSGDVFVNIYDRTLLYNKSFIDYFYLNDNFSIASVFKYKRSVLNFSNISRHLLTKTFDSYQFLVKLLNGYQFKISEDIISLSDLSSILDVRFKLRYFEDVVRGYWSFTKSDRSGLPANFYDFSALNNSTLVKPDNIDWVHVADSQLSVLRFNYLVFSGFSNVEVDFNILVMIFLKRFGNFDVSLPRFLENKLWSFKHMLVKF